MTDRDGEASAAVEKLIYVIRKGAAESVQGMRGPLVERVVPGLRDAGTHGVRVELADLAEDARVRPEILSGAGATIAATIAFWLDTVDTRTACEEAIALLGRPSAGYLVTESIVQEYADPKPMQGTPSPGVTQLVTFPKPSELDDETFFARWHGQVSPMSARLHPTRLRYERNVVARTLTPDAPPWRAIVMERWGRLEEWLDPAQLYSSMDLFREMQAVGFADPSTVNLTLSSEWVFAEGD